MVGTAGCSNAAGGSGMDDQTKTEHKYVADICGEEHKCKVAGCTEHGYTHPAYMNVTGDFEGQCFIESDADWYYDNDRNTKFTNHYNDANQYIDCKVAELNKLLQKKDTGSALSNQISIALNNFNNKTTISQNIDNNYNVLAPIFKAMRNSLTANVDYNRFNVSYWQLAGDAYKNSFGKYVTNDSFTSLDELKNKPTNFFVQELPDAGLSYQSATNSQQATKRMNDYLSTIAYNTNTNVTVLKKVVELALYNESLYGLNDHAVAARANNQGLNNNQRTLMTFDSKITDISLYNIQNIDDRTM